MLLGTWKQLWWRGSGFGRIRQTVSGRRTSSVESVTWYVQYVSLSGTDMSLAGPETYTSRCFFLLTDVFRFTTGLEQTQLPSYYYYYY